MCPKIFRHSRNAAVSVLFAAASIPMVGLVGLAIDFGVWNQSNAELSVAANVAALIAVKITANAQLAGQPQAQAQQAGVTAGQQWFEAQVGIASKPGGTNIGTDGVTLTGYGTAPVNVIVTPGTTVTATVQYTGTMPSIFGGTLFGITNYPISGQAAAQISSAPYLNVEILLDNSASMLIGATNNDIIALQSITPCYTAQIGANAPGAFYPTGKGVYGDNLADQQYAAYQTYAYDGGIAVPAVAPQPPLTYNAYTVAANPPLTCQGALLPVNGVYPNAGPPCAFACHFDGSKPAGSGNDFYALARSTSGTASPIVLRFDLVKAATNEVVAAMQTDAIPTLNNLQVGLFTFASSLLRVYPEPSCGTTDACNAGYDWTTAIADVGGPPSFPHGPDTGIQPVLAANAGDSDFHDSMTTLAGQLTASGDGTTRPTARKVLFLVTDGLSDFGPGAARAYSAVSPSDCSLFKSMGYTVYVVFTPYYPVMNGFYFSNIKSIAEPLDSGQLATNLQACASTPSDYISASSASDLNTALQTFLKAALNTPARFTM